MFTLTRITSVPASPLRVIVAEPDGADAGLNVGGSFFFQPAPTGEPLGPDRVEDDHKAGMSEHAARSIMADPGLVVHFRCDPPLPSLEAAPADATPAANRSKKARASAPADPQPAA